MKKILILLVFLSLLMGTAVAYELTITAPGSVQVGTPIIVNGTTNVQPGTTVEIVLSRSEFTSTEVARKAVTIQSAQNFTISFDTKGLVKGIYKLEVLPLGGIKFLGNSVTLRAVELVDRSDEITLKSPIEQEFSGHLRIEGTIKNLKNEGVQINVTNDKGIVIFGPEYIATTTDGSFSKSIPIQVSGVYDVAFADSKGFIGIKTFSVKEIPSVTTTIPTAIATIAQSVYASADVSRDKPAYFKITTRGEPVRVYTSTGIDLVMEYTDAQGVLQKMNSMGSMGAEEVTFPANRDIIYIMVYPYKFADNGSATLYAENAASIDVSGTVPTVFSGSTTATTTSTTKSPLPIFLPLVAIVIGLVCWGAIRRK